MQSRQPDTKPETHFSVPSYIVITNVDLAELLNPTPDPKGVIALIRRALEDNKRVVLEPHVATDFTHVGVEDTENSPNQ